MYVTRMRKRHIGHHIYNDLLCVRCCCADNTLPHNGAYSRECPCSGNCPPLSSDCIYCSSEHCGEYTWDTSDCNGDICCCNLICPLPISVPMMLLIMPILLPCDILVTSCFMCNGQEMKLGPMGITKMMWCANDEKAGVSPIIANKICIVLLCQCCGTFTYHHCVATGEFGKHLCSGLLDLIAYCCSTQDCNTDPYYLTTHRSAIAPITTQPRATELPSSLRSFSPVIAQQPISSITQPQPLSTSSSKLAWGSPAMPRASRATSPLPGGTYPRISSQEITCDFSDSARLGDGGFGIVYRGQWKELPVAIKQLRLPSLNGEIEKQFHQEVEIGCKLKNPHLVIMFGAVTDRQPYCMILELMEISLYQELHSDKMIAWNERQQWGWEIADGLNYLHAQKPPIVHRDLKSHNVMLDKKRVAKVGDFGLARVKLETGSQIYLGRQAGTLRWVPPEVLKGGDSTEYSQYTDIYSYGMTLWEIASRKIPFNSMHDNQIIMHWIGEGKRPTVPEDTPKVFREIIQGCWAAEPKDRPLLSSVLEKLKSFMMPQDTSTDFAGNSIFK